MTRLTRRDFVGSAALAATVPLVNPSFAYTKPAPAYVRPNVYSRRGQAMLALYEKAIGVMKTRADGDPTSFNFQWYTHWTPGTASDDVTKSQKIAMLPAAQRPAAQAMWNTCQGHGMNRAKTVVYFLPWHRMQLYYLEEIVRAACGDRSFTMPYWNYLGSKTEGVIPAPFQNTRSPLYNPDRRPPGHPGSGVNFGEWVPNSTVNYDCLELSDYYSDLAVPPNFSSTINNNPHGIMHDQIGNEYATDVLRAGMSFIPTAAGDPIFFLHHCNIDRIWASWNAGGNKNPDHDPNWAKKTFEFANAQGTVAEYVVGNYSDIKELNYSYEKLEPVPTVSVAVAAATPTVRGFKPETVGASLAIKLSGSVLTVPLAAAKGRTLLRAAPAGSPSGSKVYLVVEGLQIDRLPGTQYDIYLGVPKGAAGDALKPYYAGTPSFFEAAGMPGMGQDFTFDVSALAARLQKEGNAAPVVTIVPRGGPPMPGSNPAIAKISLVQG